MKIVTMTKAQNQYLNSLGFNPNKLRVTWAIKDGNLYFLDVHSCYIKATDFNPYLDMGIFNLLGKLD